MSVKLKPYSEYKDSGISWLGQLPKHWEVPRPCTILRERGETNGGGGVTDVLSVMRERGVIHAEKGNVGNKNRMTSPDTRSFGQTISWSIA